jgi:hypothetical protein
MTTLTQYAKAAQHLPMIWLTQTTFPATSLVTRAFRDAVDELPAPDTNPDALLRAILENVASGGSDPRDGTFQEQATRAAAQLHDRVAVVALQPKAKKAKVRPGSILHGYCGGILDDSYGHRLVTERGDGWINYLHTDGDLDGRTGRHHGNLKELAEYLVPDTTHCPEGCTLGQD